MNNDKSMKNIEIQQDAILSFVLLQFINSNAFDGGGAVAVTFKVLCILLLIATVISFITGFYSAVRS